MTTTLSGRGVTGALGATGVPTGVQQLGLLIVLTALAAYTLTQVAW